MKEDGRGKILEIAWKQLQEAKDPDKVTVRAISKEAGVSLGLLNYHFPSKDHMLMEAVGAELAKVATRWQMMAGDERIDPKKGLYDMLLMLMELGAEQLYLIKIASKFELTEGAINTPWFILPYVQRITGFDDMKSKMIAHGMICAMQSAVLKEDAYKDYMGLCLAVKADRETFVRTMIEGCLGVCLDTAITHN